MWCGVVVVELASGFSLHRLRKLLWWCGVFYAQSFTRQRATTTTTMTRSNMFRALGGNPSQCASVRLMMNMFRQDFEVEHGEISVISVYIGYVGAFHN